MRYTLAAANVPLVRRQNRATILRAILGFAPLSRRAISQKTGLTPSTVTSIVTELAAAGIVRELGSPTNDDTRRRAGRPEVLVDLEPRSSVAIGVAVGVHQVLTSVGDLRANVLKRVSMRTEVERGAEDLSQRVNLAVREVLADMGVDRERVIGLGISTIGLVDGEAGVVKFAPELGWDHTPLRDLVEAATGFPVIVESNHRAVALAEMMFGLGQSLHNFMVVHIGSAIGAGIVVGQRLYRGHMAGDGQLGHAVVLGARRVCECGRTGCLNTVASEEAIERNAARIARRAPRSGLARAFAEAVDRVPAAHVYSAASAGDRAALTVIQEAGRHLGLAISSLVSVLDLDLVVLSGNVVDACPSFLDIVRSTVQAHAFRAPGLMTTVLPTSFGTNSTIVGALARVLHDRLYSPTDLAG